MCQKKCSVEGCNNPVEARGYCNPHYLRLKRYGDPLGGGAFRKAPAPKKCKVDGCQGYARVYGYCSPHAHAFARYGDPLIRKRKRRGVCSVPGCNAPHVARGLCKKHYMQLYKNGILGTSKLPSGVAKIHKREYDIYLGVRKRCYNKKSSAYKNYGARGIRMCDRWLERPNGFLNFLTDMGEFPGDEYSLDRVDNNGDYCPENCRWATRDEQANNKRNNILITQDGKTRTLAEWAKVLGINYWTLYDRYKRHGATESILF